MSLRLPLSKAIALFDHNRELQEATDSYCFLADSTATTSRRLCEPAKTNLKSQVVMAGEAVFLNGPNFIVAEDGFSALNVFILRRYCASP